MKASNTAFTMRTIASGLTSSGVAESPSAAEILAAAAQTYREKKVIYGDNYKCCGAALSALFPHGLTLKGVDDFNRFHIFALALVKASRYAVNFPRGGHQDSIHDMAVYAAMLEAMDAEIKGRLDEPPSRN